MYFDVRRCWQNGDAHGGNDWLSGAYNLEDLLEDNFTGADRCECSLTDMFVQCSVVQLLISFAAACSQRSLWYRWLTVCLCVSSNFFQIATPRTVFLWLSWNLAHMIYVAIQKKLWNRFPKFQFKNCWWILLNFKFGTAAPEFSRLTALPLLLLLVFKLSVAESYIVCEVICIVHH